MSTALTRLQDEHKQRLQATKAKTIESIFEHAAAVLAFYEDCKKQREWGENTFANRIGEWCNYSASTASEWLMVARNQRKFIDKIGDLPQDKHSLALLAPLPQEDIEECLALKGPDTTQQDIIAFKRALKAPPPAQIAADKAARQAEMEARHAKELAQSAKPKALSAPYQEMVDEAQAATDTLKEFLKQFASAPRLTCKGNEYVLAVLNALASDLVNNEEARKIFGRTIASMYHPDSGKVRKDHDLMASWNAFVTQLED